VFVSVHDIYQLFNTSVHVFTLSGVSKGFGRCWWESPACEPDIRAGKNELLFALFNWHKPKFHLARHISTWLDTFNVSSESRRGCL